MKTIALSILLAGMGIEYSIRQTGNSDYVISTTQAWYYIVIFLFFVWGMCSDKS